MRRIFILLLISQVFQTAAYCQLQCTFQDIYYHLQRNNHTFALTWEKCGHDSWGSTEATTQCIMKAYPSMTQSCVSCFGNYAGCARSNCWFQCIGGSTPRCESCVKESCAQTLEVCTGVSYYKLPSRT